MPIFLLLIWKTVFSNYLENIAIDQIQYFLFLYYVICFCFLQLFCLFYCTYIAHALHVLYVFTRLVFLFYSTSQLFSSLPKFPSGLIRYPSIYLSILSLCSLVAPAQHIWRPLLSTSRQHSRVTVRRQVVDQSLLQHQWTHRQCQPQKLPEAWCPEISLTQTA